MTTTKIKFALAVIATLLSFAAVVLGSCQRADDGGDGRSADSIPLVLGEVSVGAPTLDLTYEGE